MGGGEGGGEIARAMRPAASSGAANSGQDVGRIDQGLLGGLADSRLRFVGENVEDEPGSQPQHQEIAGKEADRDVHRPTMLQPSPRWVAMGSSSARTAFNGAQGLDMGVHRALQAFAAILPDRFHDLGAGEYPSGAFQQQGEQQIFVAGQRQPGAVVGDAQALGIHLELRRPGLVEEAAPPAFPAAGGAGWRAPGKPLPGG